MGILSAACMKGVGTDEFYGPAKFNFVGPVCVEQDRAVRLGRLVVANARCERFDVVGNEQESDGGSLPVRVKIKKNSLKRYTRQTYNPNI